ncbi:MAG: type II secretion system GspH family protein, partial [Fusobacterium sp.]|nr:type II secretion system GspH family protein [Fusobacterium sp.]
SRGFTMAEILLSLTIIGVVAAITLPSLTGNINERTWNTQRKALYSRISQAVALMPALNGYGTLTGTIGEDGTQTITQDNATETFITNGLAKVLKINNICDSENLTDCGLPDKIVPMQGRVSGSANIQLSSIKTLSGFNSMFNFSDPDGLSYSYRGQLITKAAAFETANGESILTYYSPTCRSDDDSSFGGKYVQPFMCVNFVYDLNGKKGPNTVGKDIGFISVLYPSDPVVVAPLPVVGASISSTFDEASRKCREKDENYRVPNFEELASIFYNKLLVGEETGAGTDYWSSKRHTDGKGWLLKLRSGTYYTWSQAASLKCVQR